MAPPPSTAFVLGAGLGTRLKSLTSQRPKPLLPVRNEPLITWAFRHLHQAGVRQFVINTHWRAEAYPETFPDASWNGCPLHFTHESPQVLETAGGLKAAEPFLPKDTPFWVYNGDILSTLPLAEAWAAHQSAQNEVTLVLRSKDGPLQVAFDPTSHRVLDLGRRLLPSLEPRFLFTGIYLVEPAFLRRIPPATPISVIPLFLEMIRQGAPLGAVVLDQGQWWDLGTRDQILAVHQALASPPPLPQPALHPTARIHPTAQLSPACAIGPNASIGAHAILEDSIVWPNASIEPGSHLRRCIVTSGQHVSGSHSDLDFA